LKAIRKERPELFIQQTPAVEIAPTLTQSLKLLGKSALWLAAAVLVLIRGFKDWALESGTGSS